MTNIQDLRLQLDKIDKSIAISLQEREEIIKEIAKIKSQNQLQIRDPQREQEILAKLDNDFQREVFKKILSESRKIQSSFLT